MSEPTARAAEVAELLLAAAADDPLVTIPEAAAIIGCAERNARRWLEKLASSGLIERELVEVERAGRAVRLNRILAPRQNAPAADLAFGPPAPICTLNHLTDETVDENEEETGPGAELDALFDARLGTPGDATVPWLELMPPYPSTSVVCELAASPAQPVFTGDAATDVNLMIRAYRCVHQHRTGVKARVDRSARYRLRSARTAMLEAGIREPYAWAMFRFVQHERAGAARPKIDQVFNSIAPAKFAEWFAERRAAYMQPVSLMTPSHRELLRRWRAARDALAAERPRSRLEAGNVIERHLNAATYVELTAAAARELGEMNARAVHKLAEGAWVWGDAA